MSTPPGARFARLIDLARADTSDKRRDLLREVTDLFFESADTRTSRETNLFDDVLRTVAKDMEESVLAELSNRFADAIDAPQKLVEDLADNRAIAVAGPVLKRSPLLSDDALLRLVSNHSQEHIRAIAQRDTVSPRVSDAIVRLGDDNTLNALLKNAGAEFERPTMERVIDRAKDQPALHQGVVARADVPIDLLNELYFVVEQKLRRQILSRNETVDPAELDEALARARKGIRERTAGSVNAEFAAAQRLIDDKKRDGALTPSFLISLNRDKQHTAFLIGLSEFVGLDFETTRSIIVRRDIDALAMVCRAADIERPLFVTLAVLTCGGEAAMNQAEQFGRLYAFVPVSAAQRAMRFFKVRKSAGGPAA